MWQSEKLVPAEDLIIMQTQSAGETSSTIRTHIAGIPVGDLVAQFGTPTYVYIEQTILDRIADLRDFDVIRYAQKACSNLAILDVMRRQGVLVDTVSAGEIQRALLAGYRPGTNPPEIVYTADVFDRPSLRLVVDQGIHVNVGSPDMIGQLGKIAPGRDITMRINPGFGHGHSQKTNTGGEQSKHGIWHEQLADCLIQADHFGLGVTGMHMHIGSGTDMEHLSNVCGAMERVVAQAGRSIVSISTGGGLPVAYQPGDPQVDIARFYQLWDATRKRLEDRFGHPIRLEIEPGRYLVAESGFLITEIRAVKRMGENTFYLVDAGFNDLARPVLYGAFHPMSIVPTGGITQRPEGPVIVGGPLCESGDIFTQKEGGFVAHRTLPAAAVGDFLVIECAGAYGAVMASNYNSKTMATEVLVRDDVPHVIRRRQTIEQLVQNEVIP